MTAAVHPASRFIASPRLPAADEPRGRFVLRDGSVVDVRESRPGDAAAMVAFFRRLSVESRYQNPLRV